MQDLVETACASCGTRNRIPRERLLQAPVCGRCKQPVFPSRPIVATDRDFTEQVERSPLPVLVDFWAPWCAPCRTIAPALEQIARERGGRVKIVKVNVDENPGAAARHGARSIPLLVAFRDGREVDRVVGARPKADLDRFLDRV
jgi:thioredoxin 2